MRLFVLPSDSVETPFGFDLLLAATAVLVDAFNLVEDLGGARTKAPAEVSCF